MLTSICIATFDKPKALDRTLESIFSQSPSGPYEVIVVDDGSPEEKTERVCDRHPVRYARIDRCPVYRNPSAARNMAYRMARGEVIVAQSDDVIHHSKDCLETLVSELQPGTFVLGTVVNVDESGRPFSDPNGPGYGDRLTTYVSPNRRRPLFFLGTLYRQDLYAVGGNDEEFIGPSGEDQWFALCLTQGLGLRPYYSSRVVGHHQRHSHTTDYDAVQRSQSLLRRKIAQAQQGRTSWTASGGPWLYTP